MKKNNTIQITERPDLKTSEIIKKMKDKFPVWCYLDDMQLDKEFPAPKEATVRNFLKVQEPDEETLGLSVNQVSTKYPDKQGITLRERLLLELSYFNETGEHLDIKGITFCSGSRDSDGRVPYVRFGGSKVIVGWYYLDYSDAEYGVRSAVSLLSSSSFPSEIPLEDVLEHDAITLLKSRGFTITKIY